MTQADTIEKLCYVCELQSDIIREQAFQLAQLGALSMEQKISEADRLMAEALGYGIRQ